MRERIEYWLVVAVARVLGWMPRRIARRLAGGIAWAVYILLARLRRVGGINLVRALPQLTPEERRTVLRGVYRNLGWQLVEFCRMPRYTPKNIDDWIRTEGLEHYLAARDRGNGVLVLTGHLGAWELLSLADGLSHGDGDPAARQSIP